MYIRMYVVVSQQENSKTEIAPVENSVRIFRSSRGFWPLFLFHSVCDKRKPGKNDGGIFTSEFSPSENELSPLLCTAQPAIYRSTDRTDSRPTDSIIQLRIRRIHYADFIHLALSCAKN